MIVLEIETTIISLMVVLLSKEVMSFDSYNFVAYIGLC